MTTRKRCTSSWRRRSTRPSRKSGRSRAGRAAKNDATRPRWPMIVLRSPKGWTGPKVVDGLKVEGTFRAHQVPLLVDSDHPEHVQELESWMKSYRAGGAVRQHRADSCRSWPSWRPRATAGWAPIRTRTAACCCATCGCRTFATHAVNVPSPGAVTAQDTMVLGKFLRDVAKLNQEQRNFRVFGPDETLSNLLGAVFETTNRQWDARKEANDEFLAPTGGVLDSMLSEHQCEGWLEGYLLDRTPWPLQQLRGLHSHRRLDVQPARQVAEGDLGAPLAAKDRVVELPACLTRLAAGSQRLHPPGPGLSRPRHQQKGRHRAGLSAARRELSARRSSTTACGAGTTSTSSSPASTPCHSG